MMTEKSLRLIYFSPTGTTGKILRAIAEGTGSKRVLELDITDPHTRESAIPEITDDLIIAGVPVYGGRVQPLLMDYLNKISGHGRDIVLVVVYGNRDFDDALLELYDMATESGFRTVACAAFIGEHSFSTSDTPIARARPDSADLNKAHEMGVLLSQGLLGGAGFKSIDLSEIPGKRPYKEKMNLPPLAPVEVNDVKCINCGKCAEVCPSAAINPENIRITDPEKCILCMACLKNCPSEARIVRGGPVRTFALKLNKTCELRKEPEVFIDI